VIRALCLAAALLGAAPALAQSDEAVATAVRHAVSRASGLILAANPEQAAMAGTLANQLLRPQRAAMAKTTRDIVAETAKSDRPLSLEAAANIAAAQAVEGVAPEIAARGLVVPDTKAIAATP